MGTYISHIAGREPYFSEKMKPHPHLLLSALSALHSKAHAGVLIGDSLTDIAAAREAGVQVVGYANKPGKLESFSVAGADAVITTLADVADALLSH